MILYSSSRAVVPTQSNVIEAGPNMMRESEKEWHYNCSGERKGPVSFQEVRHVHVCETTCTKGWAKLEESICKLYFSSEDTHLLYQAMRFSVRSLLKSVSFQLPFPHDHQLWSPKCFFSVRNK
jgi:hypothetical protein